MYRQWVISKNDKFQTIRSSLNQVTSSNNRNIPLLRGHRVCAQAKTNRVTLVSPELNPREQLLDASELWRRIRDRSMQLLNLRQLPVFSPSRIRIGADSQECCATLRTFDLTSL